MCVMVNEEARSLLHDYINVKYIFLTQKRLQVAPKFSYLICRIEHIFIIYPYKFIGAWIINTYII